MSGKSPAAQRQRSESQAGKPKESLRVLHAEDSDDCAVLVRRALRIAGFSLPPLRFRDGEDAIGHLSTADPDTSPDVILLDIHMPQKDGFAVLDWVRRHPRYQAVPVLMLTSSESPEDIQRAERLGATKFLHKDGTYLKMIAELEQLVSPGLKDGGAQDGAARDGKSTKDGAGCDHRSSTGPDRFSA